MTGDAERLTIEELERVLTSERFATIHDLARSDGLRSLAEGAETGTGDAGEGHTSGATHLPNRR